MLLRIASVALTATAVVALPSSAHAATSGLEAEAMSALSGRTLVIADPTASGGHARVLLTPGGISGSVTAPVTARQLVVRLRGVTRLSGSLARVWVDGKYVGTLSAGAGWRSTALPGQWAAGSHRVAVTRTDRLTGTGTITVDAVRFANPVQPPAPALAPYEARIVALVNAERAKAGLQPLAVSDCATGYAESWSAHMASSGSFAHRTDLGDVMSSCHATGVGENIAYGNVTADQMMAMWMGSAGHRANILNPGYTHLGVGAVATSAGRVYGTQNFLRIG